MKLKQYQTIRVLKSMIFTLLIQGLIFSSCAQELYVSPNGNDANPGTKNQSLNK